MPEQLSFDFTAAVPTVSVTRQRRPREAPAHDHEQLVLPFPVAGPPQQASSLAGGLGRVTLGAIVVVAAACSVLVRRLWPRVPGCRRPVETLRGRPRARRSPGPR